MRPLAAAALVGAALALWPLSAGHAADRPARTPAYVCDSMTWSATAGATVGKGCTPAGGVPADGPIHGRFLLKGRSGGPTVACPAHPLGAPSGQYNSKDRQVWAGACHRL
ncbi:hypothetical protein AAHZ94_13175 [Streptomyces sp. HSW2009]|uniref:hypothetical protein n=1 Tax=Streptomyces sp. HSW2009 TaxID=3142890 RepID=UPI0032EFAAD5